MPRASRGWWPRQIRARRHRKLRGRRGREHDGRVVLGPPRASSSPSSRRSGCARSASTARPSLRSTPSPSTARDATPPGTWFAPSPTRASSTARSTSCCRTPVPGPSAATTPTSRPRASRPARAAPPLGLRRVSRHRAGTDRRRAGHPSRGARPRRGARRGGRFWGRCRHGARGAGMGRTDPWSVGRVQAHGARPALGGAGNAEQRMTDMSRQLSFDLPMAVAVAAAQPPQRVPLKPAPRRLRALEVAQLIPLSWRPEAGAVRALRQHGVDAELALARYIEAMLRDKVLRKRWVRRSFLLWVERSVLDGRLPRGRPEPPAPGEEGLDALAADQLSLPIHPRAPLRTRVRWSPWPRRSPRRRARTSAPRWRISCSGCPRHRGSGWLR